MSTFDAMRFLLLLALQKKKSQVTAQPTTRPVAESTAASQAGTLPELSGLMGRSVVGATLCDVVGDAVGDAVEKLFTLVKM